MFYSRVFIVCSVISNAEAWLLAYLAIEFELYLTSLNRLYYSVILVRLLMDISRKNVLASLHCVVRFLLSLNTNVD